MRVRKSKMLVLWWWAPKYSKEMTERFKGWKSEAKYEVLYPISTVVGSNKAFSMLEATT